MPPVDNVGDLVAYARKLHCLVWVTYPKRLAILQSFYGLKLDPLPEPSTDFPCEDVSGQVDK